jgi:hypothetical protein
MNGKQRATKPLNTNALQVHVQQLQKLPLFDPLELFSPLLKHFLIDLWLPSEQFDHPEHVHNYPRISALALFIASKLSKRTFTDPLNTLIGSLHPLRLHTVDHRTN